MPEQESSASVYTCVAPSTHRTDCHHPRTGILSKCLHRRGTITTLIVAMPEQESSASVYTSVAPSTDRTDCHHARTGILSKCLHRCGTINALIVTMPEQESSTSVYTSVAPSLHQCGTITTPVWHYHCTSVALSPN
ncbi:hypothetical protein RRG08_001600 [Elysia crispata]|uniref:Uncharacterized protein n=1 Tax=Elysia crispata TaxID=231223 RepID=A0AAE1E0M4_9GAST|nr:hypothetical protein RRG08_001600 [Elysia crispata]